MKCAMFAMPPVMMPWFALSKLAVFMLVSLNAAMPFGRFFRLAAKQGHQGPLYVVRTLASR